MKIFIAFLAFMFIWVLGCILVDGIFKVKKPEWLLGWGAIIYIVAHLVSQIIKE